MSVGRAGWRLLVCVLCLLPVLAAGRVLHVGPGRPLARPSDAARVAHDGDRVEIDAGTYVGDVAIWRQNDLQLVGVGGVAHLDSRQVAGGKAIWVLRGDHTLVRNIEFSGARAHDQNGAGIRLIGRGLRVSHCYFHDNEEGILTGAKRGSEVVVEHSEFDHNGYGQGYTHHIYVGRIDRLTVRFCYFHDARTGHHIKSRARHTRILYNRISDEGLASSYLVDVPNGGDVVIEGNLLIQGPRPENDTLVSCGTARRVYPHSRLVAINNTLVNRAPRGLFFHLGRRVSRALLANNLWVGRGRLLQGRAERHANLHTGWRTFRDPEHADFRLRPGAAAIDRGWVAVQRDARLRPAFEYRHVAAGRRRVLHGRIDVGAFEYRPVGNRQPGS